LRSYDDLSPSVRECFARLKIDIGQKPASGPIIPEGAPAASPAQVAVEELDDEFPLPPGYEEPTWLRTPKSILASTLHVNGGCVFRGDKSTGKSTAVVYLARWLKQQGRDVQLFTVQCFDGMAIEDLRGVWIAENGTTRFVYGPFALAMIYSAVNPDALVLVNCEEANMARPGIWSWVNTITAGNGDAITLPDGSRVRPTRGKFKLTLCYNEDYVGTRDINEALLDRLVPVDCTYLPPSAEARVIAAHTCMSVNDAQRITQVAKIVRANKKDHRFTLSLRALIGWSSLVMEGWSWVDAFDAQITARVGAPGTDAGDSRESVRQFALSAGIEQWPRPSAS
jgi:hypothetical protein